MTATRADAEIHAAPSAEARAALDEWRTLEERRAALLARKRRKLRLKNRLRKRAPVWHVGSDSKLYKSRLGAIEMRDEVALLDQYALLERSIDDEERVVGERVRILADHVKDARVWSRVIAGERVFVRRFIAPQERAVRTMLGAQRRFLDRSKKDLFRYRKDNAVQGNLIFAVLVLPLFLFQLLLKLQDLLLLGVVGAQKKVADTAVDAPLTVASGYEVTKQELATAEGRRRLRLAVLTERLLTPERRTVLLFLAGVVLFALYLVAEVVIRAAYPGLLAAKQQWDLVFFYSIATRIVLPTPFEVLLPTATEVLGYWPTVLCTALGGVVGSWLLFLIGAEATAGLYKLAKGRLWLKKSLDWCARVGPRHGYWILFLVMGIPFSLDSVAAAGALFRLKLGWFLGVIFLSTVVRAVIFLELVA